jgi:hypothetical protein
MDRIKSPKYEGTTFAQFWEKTDDQEEARIARNESAPKTAGMHRK